MPQKTVTFHLSVSSDEAVSKSGEAERWSIANMIAAKTTEAHLTVEKMSWLRLNKEKLGKHFKLDDKATLV
jgi:hypothetical protein